MLTPDDIRQRAVRWWDDQSVLRDYLAGEPFVDKSVGRIGLDDETDLLARFAQITTEQESLRQNSRDQLGYGYTLHWQIKHKRTLGQVRLIQRITFDTLNDWLRFIGREADFNRFVQLIDQTRRDVPELEPWLRKNPLRVLENADAWSDWLAVCRYFRDDYVADRYYVRQLPIPVHTKFLETQTSLLFSLLGTLRPDVLRPAHKDWRRRLGLLVPEPMIRVRALDALLRLDGRHEDFGLPLSAFAAHAQPAQRIFICENLLNFLLLPPLPNAIAIWSGGGFNIKCLVDVPWLQDRPLYYWGDLDAHGFGVLSQCRSYFPQTQSLLMDKATFDAHRDLVGPGESYGTTDLPFLTDDEQTLFHTLNRNNWRIEQERLGDKWVIGALASINYFG